MPGGTGSFDSLYHAAVTGTVLQVSAVPVDIGAYHILNTVAAITYIQFFYKLAAAVTIGTTVPDFTIALPASGGATLNLAGQGWRTRGALSIASTTTAGGLTGAASHVSLWKAR
jgi:hypothetical protein